MSRAPAGPVKGTPNHQRRVIAFLAAPGVVDEAPVRVFATHAALVFVGKSRALKIKRAVHLPYLDFSTLEKRRAACLREIEVNQPVAPAIYLGVVPVIERPGGELAVGGPGTAIEWAVEMRAFAQRDLLSERAAAGPLPRALLIDLADTVHAMHARAPRRAGTDAVAKMRSIVDDVAAAARRGATGEAAVRIDALHTHARNAVEAAAGVLAARAEAGSVRRCHGDLHLANIVVWDGRPTPFDAIEFDEEIATVDTLYDLAFLLMDLDRRSGRAAANLVLNRYLWRSGTGDDLAGLAAMPLFLAARAAVRALVAQDRAGTASDAAAADHARAEAAAYLDRAIGYLAPAAPCLLAIGGLSGTGKSTLAAALAPALGRAPGAVHLRSDLERKALAGVEETVRLDKDSYTPASSARVYERLCERTAAALAAGHSVIVDAVFLAPAERDAMRVLAKRHAAHFAGLWLEAPASALVSRVRAREADASDATVEVVERQAASEPGPLDWQRLDAAGTAEATRVAAGRVIAGAFGPQLGA